jgi:uncharacterized DUF497 family protein
MSYSRVIWDLPNDPAGNVAHIDEHGITQSEVEQVLERPVSEEVSRSSGRPIAFGFTSAGKSIAVIYDVIDEETVYPVTAFEVELQGASMERKITRVTRDRFLTPEEAEKYRRIREQIDAEKPEITARIRAQLRGLASVQRVFAQLKQIRESKALSLPDVEEMTGIGSSTIARLESGEYEGSTIEMMVRYAEALGKELAVSIRDNER